MAFRIAERAHGAFQTPAVSEVMVHRGLFLLVRVPPVPFPASRLSSGAFLLEAFPVPHRQHPPAGIAEFVYHVRGAALVSDVQVHGPVTLLLAALRHKGVLLPGREVQENVTTSCLLKNSAHTVDANLQKHKQVRELRLVGPRPVRFGPSARVRARHALFAHDVADASPGRGDAPPLQSVLDLPGAVAFAAVAPDRVHVAGDRVHPLGFGMFGHPVVGGAGNARYPALR